MASFALTLVVTALGGAPSADGFTDRTAAAGLGPLIVPQRVTRVAFADVDGDEWPDVLVDRHRVFLNRSDAASPIGRRFVEIEPTGLAAPLPGTLTVLADLDGDGHLDAIVTESVDHLREGWEDHGRRTGWHRGRGDGSFAPRESLPVPPRTTVGIAVSDVDEDARLDLFLASTYLVYGDGYEGHESDLLLAAGSSDRRAIVLPQHDGPFDPATDLGGRPTFGAMHLAVPGPDALAPRGLLLELSYGRRWNRAWARTRDGGWQDVAGPLGLDGDAVRHGAYPAWLAERARTDPRFDRDDEAPFRANGNTFDAATGDIDNDGDLDLLVTEITHGWAGDSSDRTRVLLQGRRPGDSAPVFAPHPRWCLDRIPSAHNWNQGDLFGALADLDHDGRLDVVISSGDYPDDQRLRVFMQDADAGLRDATAELGIDHDGAQQLSLADVDGDGDLDMIVGQSFTRYKPEQRAGRSPRLKLLVNEATRGRGAITLRLHGDGAVVARDALGTRVRVRRPGGVQTVRQLVGIGGHAGKQDDFLVHVGLGDDTHADSVEIEWPGGGFQRFDRVAAGRYRLRAGGGLEPVPPP